MYKGRINKLKYYLNDFNKLNNNEILNCKRIIKYIESSTHTKIKRFEIFIIKTQKEIKKFKRSGKSPKEYSMYLTSLGIKDIRRLLFKLKITKECIKYGQYRIKQKEYYGSIGTERERTSSHRYMYWWFYLKPYGINFEEFPSKLFVCHKCDKPYCCNPLHLFSGDNNDNMKDRDKKNRQSKGENNGNNKLNEELVVEIINSKKGAIFWSKKLNVGLSSINDIINGKTWKHITDIKYNKTRTLDKEAYKKRKLLNKEDILIIYFSKLKSIKYLSNKYNVCRQNINRIRKVLIHKKLLNPLIKYSINIKKLLYIFKSKSKLPSISDKYKVSLKLVKIIKKDKAYKKVVNHFK